MNISCFQSEIYSIYDETNSKHIDHDLNILTLTPFGLSLNINEELVENDPNLIIDEGLVKYDPSLITNEELAGITTDKELAKQKIVKDKLIHTLDDNTIYTSVYYKKYKKEARKRGTRQNKENTIKNVKKNLINQQKIIQK